MNSDANRPKTIRPVPDDELKNLGEELFPFVDDPWREVYFQFVAENRGSTFHHALTDDGVHILYCNDRDKGMWFLPGKGPLLARGRQAMKEIIKTPLRSTEWLCPEVGSEAIAYNST